MKRAGVGALMVALIGPAGPARAQDFPAPTDRDYTLDLFQGAVLGSGRIVGMGGAAQATAQGSAGTLFNPAAVAVRTDTSRGDWDWDWHVDWLIPQLGSDFDNNGMTQDADLTALLWTLGAVGQWRSWGLGAGSTVLRRDVANDESVIPTTVTWYASIGKSFADEQWTVAGAVRGSYFTMESAGQTLVTISGAALEAGAMWRPRDLDVRVGVSADLPVSSEKVDTLECDPLACEGYVLPDKVATPWQTAAGVAWRFAETRWNQRVATPFRDEKYWLLAADLVVTGHVPHGYGVEAFALHQLQPSGRNVGVSPRLGAEHEWVPGRLRVRTGTYWEPSRYRDPDGDDVAGRLHLTLGLDVRLWTLNFRHRGDPLRLRLTVTADGAAGYGNSGISIGLWH